MTTQRLLQIKEQIDNAKTKGAQISGQIQSIEDQMNTKFKVKTPEAADKELKRRSGELDKMEKDFEAGQDALEKNFPFDE